MLVMRDLGRATWTLTNCNTYHYCIVRQQTANASSRLQLHNRLVMAKRLPAQQMRSRGASSLTSEQDDRKTYRWMIDHNVLSWVLLSEVHALKGWHSWKMMTREPKLGCFAVLESWTELTPTWYARLGLLGELAVLASPS